MPSMPSVDVRRPRRKRRRHKKRQRTEVDVRQSLLGNLSLFFGLLALFLLTVQGILWAQQTLAGAPGAMHMLIPWVSRGEIVASMTGIMLALVSFPFSSRGKRNAIFGLLISAAVFGTWFWLANWRFTVSW
jgi:hypothetical protein